MEQLTKLIREDMKPALGVTEPGAIAFAVSKARSYVGGKLDRVELDAQQRNVQERFYLRDSREPLLRQ